MNPARQVTQSKFAHGEALARTQNASQINHSIMLFKYVHKLFAKINTHYYLIVNNIIMQHITINLETSLTAVTYPVPLPASIAMPSGDQKDPYCITSLVPMISGSVFIASACFCLPSVVSAFISIIICHRPCTHADYLWQVDHNTY